MGTYQPDMGASSCLSAPAGSFVDTTGATAATLCAAGFYQPNVGQVSCLAAPVGSFVDTAGAAEATPAPAGFFVDVVGERQRRGEVHRAAEHAEPGDMGGR